MVERQLPKLNVAGSIPVSRSISSSIGSVQHMRVAGTVCCGHSSHSCIFSTKAVKVFSLETSI